MNSLVGIGARSWWLLRVTRGRARQSPCTVRGIDAVKGVTFFWIAVIIVLGEIFVVVVDGVNGHVGKCIWIVQISPSVRVHRWLCAVHEGITVNRLPWRHRPKDEVHLCITNIAVFRSVHSLDSNAAHFLTFRLPAYETTLQPSTENRYREAFESYTLLAQMS